MHPAAKLASGPSRTPHGDESPARPHGEAPGGQARGTRSRLRARAPRSAAVRPSHPRCRRGHTSCGRARPPLPAGSGRHLGGRGSPAPGRVLVPRVAGVRLAASIGGLGEIQLMLPGRAGSPRGCVLSRPRISFQYAGSLRPCLDAAHRTHAAERTPPNPPSTYRSRGPTCGRARPRRACVQAAAGAPCAPPPTPGRAPPRRVRGRRSR
jgi:hypothetical protein